MYTIAFENFWEKWGAGERVKSKGSKRKAQESWVKQGKKRASEEDCEYDEREFAQAVWRGYDAMIRNRKAMDKSGRRPPYLPHVVTWLNGWGWEEQFERSVGELKHDSLSVERACECGSTDIIGRAFSGGWICRACDIKAWQNGHTHAYASTGKRPSLSPLVSEHPRLADETWREWSIRVMSTWPVGRKLLERYRR